MSRSPSSSSRVVRGDLLLKLFVTGGAGYIGSIVTLIHVEDLSRAHLLALQAAGEAKPGEHRV